MKLFFTILYLSAFIFCFGQTKHALILAVGNYPEIYGNNSWKKINSLNDLEKILPMLDKQIFLESNQVVLKEEQVTVENIDQAFDNLIKKVEKGDIIYFHFSGHGQQIQDIDSDEADGYDEALVCFDAPQVFYNDYKFEKHYSDDRLKTKVDAIRKKIGAQGQVILVIDACHSGTITRGNNTIFRGSSIKCQSPNYKPKGSEELGAFGTDFEYEEASIGQLFAFSGCRANQKNKEYTIRTEKGEKNYGSLSYFLVEGISKLKENASYDNLLSYINRSMVVQFNNDQQPELEASNKKQLIFRGDFVFQENYYEIKGDIEDVFEIKAGQLNNIHAGDTLGIYELTATDPNSSKQLGKAVVLNEIGPSSCWVKKISFDNSLPTNGIHYRLFKTFENNAIAPLKLTIDVRSKKKELKEAISKVLQNIEYVESGCQYMIKEETEGNNKGKFIIIIGSDGNTSFKGMDYMSLSSDEEMNQFVKHISDAYRIDFFRKMDEFSDKGVKFKLTVQEVDSNFNALGEKFNDLTQCEINKYYRFTVVNSGYKKCYFYILNIESNYKIKHMINFQNDPQKNHFELNPSENSSLVIQFSDPGLDQYLFLASSSVLDLNPIIELGKPIPPKRNSNETSKLLEGFLNSSCTGAKTRSSGNNMGISLINMCVMVEQNNFPEVKTVTKNLELENVTKPKKKKKGRKKN